GLVQKLQAMRAGDENQLCLRHLYQNFKNFFGEGTLLKDLVMGASKATYEEAWEDKMTQIKEDRYTFINPRFRSASVPFYKS
ncbi:hypothetical protein D0Y65_035648, partial [Glycine soja]